MWQHPRITVSWALSGLETAVCNLGNGPAERRVRDQLHQLVLALERDGYAEEAGIPVTVALAVDRDPRTA